MNLSCRNCKTIQSFSGDPLRCDKCGWVYTSESMRKLTPRVDAEQTDVAQVVPTPRRSHKFAWIILLVAFVVGIVLDNKAPASSAGFWVMVLGLGAFVVLFLGFRDIRKPIARGALPIGKAIIGLFAAAIAFAVVTNLAPSLFPESPWAYALKYDTSSNHVHVLPKPTDCDFLHAPIGFKDCHYEKSVQVTRYSTDVHSRQPIVSYDGGKTWRFVPEGEKTGPAEVDVGWVQVREGQ